MSDSPTNSAQDLLRKYGIQDTSQISIDDLIWAEGCIYEEKSMTGAEGRIIFHGGPPTLVRNVPSGIIRTENQHVTRLVKKRFDFFTKSMLSKLNTF